MSGNIIQSNTENSNTNASVYSGMNEVFEHTRHIITEMSQGDKIGIRDLADKVHAQIKNMSSGNVMNLVQMFCKQSKDVTVEVGRGGGVFKGGKQPRVDNRERCTTCNQVIRANMSHKNADTTDSEELVS